MKNTLITSALTLAASMAHAGIVSGNVTAVIPDTAAANQFTIKTPTVSSPLTVGKNNTNVNDSVFGFNELQNVSFGNAPSFDLAGSGSVNSSTLVSSHYVYFDPAISQKISATVTFDGQILGVYWVTGTFDSISKSGTSLKGSQDNFGLPSNLVTYQYASLTGLESRDKKNTSLLGNTLTLSWTASNPGDHIRVITAAVPEPETYAMLLAGLGVMGAIARRRKANQA